MPVQYAPSATDPAVWTWPGFPYKDPYAYVTHNDLAVPAYELAQHQSVTLMLRNRAAGQGGVAPSFGLKQGLFPGLFMAPVAVELFNAVLIPKVLTRDQSGLCWTNTGSSGAASTRAITLPPALAGLTAKFFDTTGGGIRVLPSGLSNILFGELSSAAGGGGLGYVETTTRGMIYMECDGVDWHCINVTCSQNGLL